MADVAPFDRLNNPIFAFSKEIRNVSNMPRIVWEIELGIYRPRHANFDDAMQVLASKFQTDTVFHLGHSLIYTSKVVPAAKLLHVKYPTFPLNSLKALNAYTVDMPNYYGAIAELMYGFGESKTNEDFEPFGDFLYHFNTGIVQLAKEFPETQPLLRIAWLPTAVWGEYFDGRVGEEVVLMAPGSAAGSVQWSFLDNPTSDITGKVPVLFEFDTTASKTAGCLCLPGKPISAFGVSEDERTFSFYRRCAITAIQPFVSPSGVALNKVTLRALNITKPSMVFLVSPRFKDDFSEKKVPGVDTECVLTAGIFLALWTSTLGKPSPLVRIIEGLMEALEHAITLAEPEVVQAVMHNVWAYDKNSDWFAWLRKKDEVREWEGAAGYSAGPSFFRMIFGGAKQVQVKDEQATLQKQERTRMDFEKKRCDKMEDEAHRKSRQICLETIPIDILKESVLALVKDPMSLFRNVRETLVASVSGHETIEMWAKMTIWSEFVAGLLDGDPSAPVALLFDSPSDTFLAPTEPCAAMACVGDSLWQDTLDRAATRQDWGRRALAFADVVRLRVSTTRMELVLGRPDAGKTTYLEVVHGVTSGGGSGMAAEHRTDTITLLPHWSFHEAFRPHYLADTPGYGDSAKHRNDLVRLLQFAVVGIPYGFEVTWVHKAERDVQHRADKLFKQAAQVVSLHIIVSQVDRLVEERYSDVLDQIRKEDPEFDFPDDEEALSEDERQTLQELLKPKQQALMRDIKAEIESNFERLLEEIDKSGGKHHKVHIYYACLPNSSWACTEKKEKGGRRSRPPEHWKSAGKDVREFFDMASAEQLRRMSCFR